MATVDLWWAMMRQLRMGDMGAAADVAARNVSDLAAVLRGKANTVLSRGSPAEGTVDEWYLGG